MAIGLRSLKSSARMMLRVSVVSVGVPEYFGRASVMTCNLPIVCVPASGVPAGALPLAVVVPAGTGALPAGRVAAAALLAGAVACVPVFGGAVGTGALMFAVGAAVGVLAGVLLP